MDYRLPVKCSPAQVKLRASYCFRTAVVFLGAIVVWGCGGSEDVSSVDRSMPGYSQYSFYCSACHGKTGLGAKHLFPPLVGGTWVNLDPEIPISIVLKGLGGRFSMDGVEYMNQMPSLEKRMTDENIAAAISYVRSSFGNSSGPVTAEQVKGVRAKLKNRDDRWTVDEIKRLIASLEQEQ